MQKFQTILGIKFFTGDMEGLLELCSEGHFIVVPAAPALADLTSDPAYRASVEKSDFAITDSGLMVVLWKIFTGQSLPRISGLKLLRALLDGPEFKLPGASFWIMPSARERDINLAWLQEHGCPVQSEDCYVAPMYSKGLITDPALLSLIEPANRATSSSTSAVASRNELGTILGRIFRTAQRCSASARRSHLSPESRPVFHHGQTSGYWAGFFAAFVSRANSSHATGRPRASSGCSSSIANGVS